MVRGHDTSTEDTAYVLDDYDAVIVQHEYGIFGGEDGAEILDLLARVHVPVMTVLHTVLTHPTPGQHAVLAGVVARSDVLVTMTNTARDRLVAGWDVDPDDVVVIPHGAHAPAAVRRTFGSKRERTTLLTWGLLSQGKGIEWALRALAELGDDVEMPVYRIVGRTHPRVLERDGEAYRDSLRALAHELGIADHVVFDDRYLTLEQLGRVVDDADVVLLPYDSREQVTSGVLTEAVAAGKPVVSTAFPHAVELLSGGAGLLVPQSDHVALASALRSVLTDASLTASMAAAARGPLGRPALAHGRRPLCRARPLARQQPGRERRLMDRVVRYDHLLRLSTPLGVHEHALLSEPRPEHGMCVDDVARALVVAVRSTDDDPRMTALAGTCTRFLLDSIHDDGRDAQPPHLDGTWADEASTGDHWGRALWALGSAAVHADDAALALRALQGAERAMRSVSPWPRATAYAALGAALVLQPRPATTTPTATCAMPARCCPAPARTPRGRGRTTSSPTPTPSSPRRWWWSDAGSATTGLRLAGLELLEWLVEEQTLDGHLSVVPAHGRRRGDGRPAFDQQPIEVAALAEACRTAYDDTGDAAGPTSSSWQPRGSRATTTPVSPCATRRPAPAYDGLEPASVNFNQGAESTLAWLSTQQLRLLGLAVVR